MATPKLKRQEPLQSAQAEPTHEQIAPLAYALWQERGCPHGSPEMDWLKAEQLLSVGIDPADNTTTVNTTPRFSQRLDDAETPAEDESPITAIPLSRLRHRSRVPEAADILD
jgi:hypothetical protein